MINKLKLGLLSLVALTLFGFVGVQSVNAQALTYSADTPINFSGSGYTLTIKSGSVATSVVVNASSLDVVVPISSTFTIASTNNTDLSGVGGATSTTNTCSGTTNTRVITTGAGDTGTYTITPNGSVCAASSGGGGGGGGGSYTPPAADTTPPSATSVSINAGAVTSTTLTATLTLAATDATQMIISNDAGFTGAPWETYATSKTWTLTTGDGVKTVYAKFRDAAGNMSTAVSDTITVSGTGTIAVVTPPTQGCSGSNQYNISTGALCVNNTVNPSGQIPGCGNNTTGFSTATGGSCVGNRPTTVTASISYNLGTATLKNGSKGEAVKELQRVLNKILNLGLVVDGKLGPKTIAVIKTWQKNHGLKADGLVGKLTKAAMKAEAEK